MAARHNFHESMYFLHNFEQLYENIKGHDNKWSHNLLVGIPRKNDKILMYETHIAPRKSCTWRSELVKYPPDHAEHELKRAVINAIAIVEIKDGTGGEAIIVSGGIGSSEVIIRLNSRCWAGYAFSVTISGRYDDGTIKQVYNESLYFAEDIKHQWEFLNSNQHKFSNNIFSGVPSEGKDILLFRYVNLPGRWFPWRSEFIDYQPINAGNGRSMIITGFAIIDNWNDGTGGEAHILRGGVGCRSLTIKLQSRWFKGYSFTVIIYGRYDNKTYKESGGFDLSGLMVFLKSHPCIHYIFGFFSVRGVHPLNPLWYTLNPLWYALNPLWKIFNPLRNTLNSLWNTIYSPRSNPPSRVTLKRV